MTTMTSLRKRESLRIKNQESMRQNDLTTPPSTPPPSPTKRAAERRGMAPDSPASQSRGGSGSVRGRSAALPSAPSNWPQVEHLNGTEASPRRRSARLRSPARNGHSGSFDTILYGSLYRSGEMFDGEQMMESPKDLLSVISTATRPDLSDAVVPRRRKRDIARPIVLKGLMSGLIYMLGEAIACGLLHRNGKFGLWLPAFFKRSVIHSALVGAFANGPMLHFFFAAVDHWINFKSRLLNVVAKVVVDQVVWGCLWNGMYILLMNIATDSPGFGYVGEGLGSDAHEDLSKGMMSAFWKATDWRLHVKLLSEGLKMLPMDILCYWLVPLQLRPLWVAAVDTLWVTILSQYD